MNENAWRLAFAALEQAGMARPGLASLIQLLSQNDFELPDDWWGWGQNLRDMPQHPEWVRDMLAAIPKEEDDE